MIVESARASDLDGIRRLLTSAELPTTDLTPAMLTHFVVVRDGNALKAVGGLEWNEGSALLRSVAVDPALRRSGLGEAIVKALEDRARQAGAASLHLLTTTAALFFDRRGYRVASRSEAPAGIRSTAQFAGLCPASSTFMSKTL